MTSKSVAGGLADPGRHFGPTSLTPNLPSIPSARVLSPGEIYSSARTLMPMHVQGVRNSGRRLLKDEDAPNLFTKNFLNMPVNDAESATIKATNPYSKSFRGWGSGAMLVT